MFSDIVDNCYILLEMVSACFFPDCNEASDASHWPILLCMFFGLMHATQGFTRANQGPKHASQEK